MYGGEEFTLQLDSHHRFADEWDRKMIDALEATGSPKPILTSYAGIYDPQTDHKKSDAPFYMKAGAFTEAGTILFRPEVIPEWEGLQKPVKARFVSGHYFFTLGSHCEEDAYDPQIYFAGDEISLSIRSFTLGYDLFHPHRTFVWHEYTRAGRRKHWDDHLSAGAEAGPAWHELDTASKRRLGKLLREEENDEDLTGYGLGDVRTHRDYERYAGIDFASRRLHPETLVGEAPPCSSLPPEEWERQSAGAGDVTMRWKIEDIERCDDLQFIYFGVEDAIGRVIYRYDAPPDSPEGSLRVSERAVGIHLPARAAKLVIWPVSRSRGWLRKVEYPL